MNFHGGVQSYEDRVYKDFHFDFLSGIILIY